MPGPIIQPAQLPSWADPAQAQPNDPLYQTLARKAVGALGINDPNSIMGMGAPLSVVDDAPGGLAGAIMNSKPGQGAIEKLLELLHGYEGPKVNMPAEVAASRVGSQATRPLRFSTMFSRMLNRVPEAEGALIPGVKDKVLPRAPGVDALYAREAKFKAPTPTAKPTLVNSPTELQDLVPTGPQIGRPPQASRPLLGKYGERSMKTQMTKMATAGLSPEKILEIRDLGFDMARAKYPNIHPHTLRDIANGTAWGWVR